MNNTPETTNAQSEQGIESQQSAAEQLEKIRNNVENSAELSPRDTEAIAERARVEVLETAVGVEVKGKVVEKAKNKTSDTSRRGSINKKQRNDSYKKTMKHVQKELSTPSRYFSKVIHNPIVEKVSDTLGNTIARPDAILAGAIVAFVATLSVYIVAKTIGYSLSGSETIIAFAVGWTIGIIYDYLRLMITGKKS